MSGIFGRLTACLLGAVSCGSVPAGDFLPCEQGDHAIYEADPTLFPVTSEVDRERGDWCRLTDFAGLGRQWVASRSDSERMLILDPQLRQPVLFTDFSRPVGFVGDLPIPPCNRGTATIAAKGLQLDIPAGLFDDVVRLDLQTNCADAGVTRMWFAPGVGLVQWSEDSIAGERLYRLARGEIDGQLYPRAKGLVVSGGAAQALVWIDMMPVVGPGPRPPARLPVTLRLDNKGAQDLAYHFASAQRFDILLMDEQGAVVAQWSAGKVFPAVAGQLLLAPGGSFAMADELVLLTPAGDPVPAGNYTLEIRLASHGVADTAHQPGSLPPAIRVPLAVRWAY